MDQELAEKVAAYQDEWLRVTLSTDRADRPAAERAISGIYELSNCAPPKQFKWFESPQATLQGRKCLWKGNFIGCLLSQPFHKRDWYETPGEGNRPPTISEIMFDTLVIDTTGILIDTLDFAAYDVLWGNLDCFWIATDLLGRDGLRRTCKPEYSRLLDLFAAVARSTGLWIPYSDVCLCCERPTAHHLNNNLLLDCGDGPALAYADGFKLWALDGRVADEQLVVRPQTQAISQIWDEMNAELRRVRIERYAGSDKTPVEGWMRYLREIRAVCVDRRRNDVENVEEALMVTGHELTVTGETVLVCSCPSTARVYALEVSRQCRTVEAAQNYLHSQSNLDRLGRPNVIGRS